MVLAVSGAVGIADSTARVFLRALWIARIPVASIVAALVIFSKAEALDLFVDIPPDWLDRVLHWLSFYVAATLFWVLPVHFSARVALQLNHERIGVDTPQRYLWFVVALPRVLSGLCLLVIFYAFLQAWRHVPSVGRDTLADQVRQHLLWASVLALTLTVVCMLAFAWLSRLSVLERSKLRPIAPRLYDRLDTVVCWCKPRRRRVVEPVFAEPVAAAQHNTLISVFLLLTIVFAFDVVLSVLFLSPILRPTIAKYIPSLESYLPRAVFIPVLLGIYIPGFALLGVLSHRFRLPLVLLFLLALAIWGVFREHRHDVRPAVFSGSVQRISLQDAVNRWKRANGCERSECPQPIVVAGSGGASRAAFMTGNALAFLQDRYPNFRQRLFAMSTVSGSSLGAAAFLAGLDWKDGPPGPETCSKRRFQGWFGCHLDADPLESSRTTLQKRVQLFLSHDFLTPVAVAFTFSDMWRVLDDRAVKLEKSWEIAWRGLTNDPEEGGDFSKRLSLFVPKEKEWRPLLIFSGTSVSSGRRIIVSPLLPAYEDIPAIEGNPGKRLFVDAFDYYEMACPGRGSDRPDCDLRLSTAVAMSARFPLVSPSGRIVRNKWPVDRVVDGGYFENFGAQGAFELARALEQSYKLKPFILQITNDPSAFEYERCRERIDWEKQYHRRRPEPPSVFDDKNLLRWALDPFDTIVATRTARGTQATAEALATVTGSRYAQIRVCPELIESDSAQGAVAAATRTLRRLFGQAAALGQGPEPDGTGADAFKSLSASWWLSAPVQQYLHQQLEAPHNRYEIERVRRALQ